MCSVYKYETFIFEDYVVRLPRRASGELELRRGGVFSIGTKQSATPPVGDKIPPSQAFVNSFFCVTHDPAFLQPQFVSLQLS